MNMIFGGSQEYCQDIFHVSVHFIQIVFVCLHHMAACCHRLRLPTLQHFDALHRFLTLKWHWPPAFSYPLFPFPQLDEQHNFFFNFLRSHNWVLVLCWVNITHYSVMCLCACMHVNVNEMMLTVALLLLSSPLISQLQAHRRRQINIKRECKEKRAKIVIVNVVHWLSKVDGAIFWRFQEMSLLFTFLVQQTIPLRIDPVVSCTYRN